MISHPCIDQTQMKTDPGKRRKPQMWKFPLVEGTFFFFFFFIEHLSLNCYLEGTPYQLL